MKIFSQEADSLVREAIDWLYYRLQEPRERIASYRVYRRGMLFSDRETSTLRKMADTAVWQERGGELIRAYDKNASAWERAFHPGKTGEAAGRTQWLGMPEWAQGFGMNREQVKATVEKAIAGKKLGSKQALLIQSMLDAIAEAPVTVRPQETNDYDIEIGGGEVSNGPCPF